MRGVLSGMLMHRPLSIPRTPQVIASSVPTPLLRRHCNFQNHPPHTFQIPLRGQCLIQLRTTESRCVSLTSSLEWEIVLLSQVVREERLEVHREQIFPNCSITDIWGKMILCHGGGGSVLYSIAGLYPLDARSSPLPSCGNQPCLQTLPGVPWGAKLTPAEKH